MVIASSVHTAGVNWQATGVIVTGCGIMLGFFFSGMTWFITRRDRRQERRNDEFKQTVVNAVDNLRKELVAELETKSVVGGIAKDVAWLKGKLGVDS